jgi:hypothetical protein
VVDDLWATTELSPMSNQSTPKQPIVDIAKHISIQVSTDQHSLNEFDQVVLVFII